MSITKEELMSLANQAKERSYSPYSSFAVGSALLCKDGSVYVGTNVENISYGATCCAERVALFGAISAGKREFCAIAITATKNPCYPCGICRQVMAELCDGDFRIYTEGDGGIEEKKLCDLMPCAFDF